MDITKLAIVGLYLGINALVLMWLTFKVIGVRRSQLISLGDGGDQYLQRLMRGHGNATETMPIFFIMLGVAALLNAPTIALHAFGIAFTTGRITHAVFFIRKESALTPRFWGMLISILSIILLAIGLITHSLFIMIGS